MLHSVLVEMTNKNSNSLLCLFLSKLGPVEYCLMVFSILHNLMNVFYVQF
jgi:hypothetical protein